MERFDEMRRQSSLFGKTGKMKYRARKIDIWRRLVRQRDWCYWNFAKRLAAESQVILLKKMSFKNLGMKKKDIAAGVRRNLHLVAPADLYSKIEKQAKKYAVPVKYWKNNAELSQALAEFQHGKGLRTEAA